MRYTLFFPVNLKGNIIYRKLNEFSSFSNEFRMSFIVGKMTAFKNVGTTVSDYVLSKKCGK